MLPEQIDVTMIVADALQALGVAYAIGGSFASALHGVMRATMDADLVADLPPGQAEPLARARGDAFYADVEMIRDAKGRRSVDARLCRIRVRSTKNRQLRPARAFA
jgi:hypothetical protein